MSTPSRRKRRRDNWPHVARMSGLIIAGTQILAPYFGQKPSPEAWALATVLIATPWAAGR
jgi:hypothetical protein